MNNYVQNIFKSEEETPMMQQYMTIKKEHPESILFFRMGDFYEMFNEDAKIASEILEITLTSRNKNKANPTPMCGIPHHSSKSYIAKLLKSGKKVAICEQTEDPKLTKGLVKREVVRVVTPGTILDDSLLDPKQNHFLVSLYSNAHGWGFAALDITTGLFKVTEFYGDNRESLLQDEIEKFDPKEIILSESLVAGCNKPTCLNDRQNRIQSCENWTFSFKDSYRILIEHFKISSLEGFGCENMKLAISSAGALIQYLHTTQKSALKHISKINVFNIQNHMLMDQATVRNLELVKSSEGERKNSLLDLLDLSQTAMGARCIREWILKPNIDIHLIRERLEQVDFFKSDLLLRQAIRDQLKSVHDMERLLGRISLSFCNARDIIALKISVSVLPNLLKLLNQSNNFSLNIFKLEWDNLQSLHELIEKKIVSDPPLSLKDGNCIKTGCNSELDQLKTIARDGKNWIAQLETKEKERTGISILKVGFNRIYGYYIEITKKNLDRVPVDYIRKQSLVNAERFISPELKEFEEKITGAQQKAIELEHKIFQQTREEVASHGLKIQKMALVIANLDAIISLAEVAHNYNYSKPEISEGTDLTIKNGRHPLIERIIPENQFITNDTQLNNADDQITIITGPNMAGKSTYLRQVSLITLMAQIGSFIPADSAQISIVDRIFSRVGAQDHLQKGMSTFMVEMTETANILNNATEKSLIILDEIGRGTSTFDGISIAWSIVEYLHGNTGGGPKTLFATHYHELTDLASVLKGVKNFKVQVKEWNDEIIFLRKIIPGGADKSYGIQVARLAGLPEKVLHRAREVLLNLEKRKFDDMGAKKTARSKEETLKPQLEQGELFSKIVHPAIKQLEAIDPDNLSPRQAMEALYLLKNLINKTPK
jgi:DNA mismatch repair protein MutS